LDYVLEKSKFEHCGKCRPEQGIVGGTAVSHVRGNLVDLENNLIGIDRPNTRCPSYKWQPVPEETASISGKEYIKPVCHPLIDTRMVHLKPCQFHDTPTVFQPPQPNVFSCNKR
jgi:hypothetical protein